MAVAAGTAWPSRSAIAPRRVSRSFIRDLLLYENGYTTCYNIRMRLHNYAPRPAHLKWLLDSDPSIRWQVMRDLTGKPPARLQPSGLASQPKAGEPNCSPANLLLAIGVTPPAGGEKICRSRTGAC